MYIYGFVKRHETKIFILMNAVASN
jgi:hypothetical protein